MHFQGIWRGQLVAPEGHINKNNLLFYLSKEFCTTEQNITIYKENPVKFVIS